MLWEKMIGVDQKPDAAYPGGGTRINAYWRTLLADQIVDKPSMSAKRLCPSDFEDFELWKECRSHMAYTPNKRRTEEGAEIPWILGRLEEALK